MNHADIKIDAALRHVLERMSPPPSRRYRGIATSSPYNPSHATDKKTG